jgi:hypothetical protein
LSITGLRVFGSVNILIEDIEIAQQSLLLPASKGIIINGALI